MRSVKRLLTRAVYAALICAAAGILFGCATPCYDVEVYLSPKIKDKYQVYPSLELDLIGVNQTDLDRFDSLSVNDYFVPGNPFRDGMDHVTVYFSDDNSGPKVVKRDNPVWGKFGHRNADRLVLIVNLPGADQYKGKKNPCRVDIPLERSWWRYLFFSYETKYIEVLPGGISLLSGKPKDVRVTPEPVAAKEQEE